MAESPPDPVESAADKAFKRRFGGKDKGRTKRDDYAHAVLAPAVEGFPPTQQFPDHTEAQTLLAALWGSDAMRNAVSSAADLPADRRAK